MNLRPYCAVRFTNHGLKPYAGVALYQNINIGRLLSFGKAQKVVKQFTKWSAKNANHPVALRLWAAWEHINADGRLLPATKIIRFAAAHEQAWIDYNAEQGTRATRREITRKRLSPARWARQRRSSQRTSYAASDQVWLASEAG
jgi:hypothetical protein